jgi:xanthine/CO dehydrogenase XdhC/CoxF family maturation factor
MLREISEEMQRLIGEPDGGTLVTITRTTGSAYRREGAKMVCSRAGMVGSVSGGCLEGDIAELSLVVVERDQPQIVTYDTNAENENVWGLGLGCNGTVEVLVEPMRWWRTEEGKALFDAIMNRVNKGERCAIVTLLEQDGEQPRSLRRLLLDPAGNIFGTLGSRALDTAAAQRARSILNDESVRPSRRITLEHNSSPCEMFVDAIVPATHILVVGGGHDAIPVVRMARELGLRVTLIDSRPNFATRDRFPEADQVLCVQPEEFAQKVSFEGAPAIILMNHNYQKDLAVLAQVLTSPAEFTNIGELGPHARTEQMLGELRKEGLKMVSHKVDQVRTPIGLDLGADSPQEIALAMLAELLAVKNRRSGMALRDKKRAIHEAA